MSSTRVIFAAAFDRMLPEWVSKIEPRTRTPIYALLLMVIPGAIVSFMYAFNICAGMQSIVLDATLVIAITFFGTAIAAIVLPWRQKSVFDGSPIAKYKMPTWLSWLVTLLFAAGVVYLLYLTYTYAMAVFAQWPDQTALTQAMIVVVAVLGLLNVVLLLWLAYYVIRKLLAGEKLPLVTVAGLVFFAFLDWLLVEWFWDPDYLLRHRLAEQHLDGVHDRHVWCWLRSFTLASAPTAAARVSTSTRSTRTFRWSKRIFWVGEPACRLPYIDL